MSTKTIGTAAELVTQQEVFDPVRGTEIRQTYKGTEAQLASLASGYLNAGIRSELTNTGGVPTLTVYLIANEDGGGGSEVPTDRWDIGKEYVLKPMWDHPWVKSVAYLYLTQNTGILASTFSITTVNSMVALFRLMISNWLNGKAQTGGFGPDETWEDAARGAPLLPSYALSLVGLAESSDLGKLYSAAIASGTDSEIERVTVSRMRTFSVAYSTRMVLNPITKVWTTSSLNSEFSVPAVVQNQLPADPGAQFTPENTVWAWKLTADHSTINYYGKVEETKEWVFGNWPSVLFEVV